MLTIHNRVPHEKLSCLQPCTRVLACGHKCSGVCTDPCRCRQDCDQFKTIQAERQMAQLQLEPTPLPPTTIPVPAPVQSRDSSPEKWVEFSRNPEIHDNVIRRARIQAMQPLIELDTPPTSTANASRNTIKERWIPISNRDGVRVVGKQAEDCDRSFPKASSQTQIQKNDRRHRTGKQQRGGPQTQNQGRAQFRDNRSETVTTRRDCGNTGSRAKGRRNQVQARPTLQQERLNQRRQQQPVPPNNSPNFEARGPFQSPVSGLEALAPVRVQAAADSISLMGESDLGFEAEVLGIRRSRLTGDGSEVNVNTVPGHFQEGMDIVVESLVSFGGDGAVSPAKPASSPKKDEEEELLIDFD